MAKWIDEEKEDILDTRPPCSPQYPEAEDNEVVEVATPIEVLKQASLVDPEEEEIASNPPPTEDEPAPITLKEADPITLNEAALVVPDEATLINLEEEPDANTTDDAFPPPSLKPLSLFPLSDCCASFFLLECNGLFG